MIFSVQSTYGHRFTSGSEYDETGQGNESCLTCGALYRLELNPDPDSMSQGVYVTNGGAAPRWCSGDTGQVHGYPGERACIAPACDAIREVGSGFAPCAHESHDCNCLQCD